MGKQAMMSLHYGPPGRIRRCARPAAVYAFALAWSLMLFSCGAFLTKAPDDPMVAAPGGADEGSFFRSASRGRLQPRPLSVNQPVQVTFEADPVRYAAVSRDGRRLVYTVSRGDFSELIVRSLEPGAATVPKKLLREPGPLSAPAVSNDGRWIAYVGAGYDVKGDIYLLEWRREGAKPRRLTGRATEDGAPAFSPDGGRIIFHQARPGESGRRIVALDLNHPEGEPTVLGTPGDAAFPALSPDGKKCAFVSFSKDSGGDIAVLDLESGAVTTLTRGPEWDLFPVWSADGAHVCFTPFFPRHGRRRKGRTGGPFGGFPGTRE